MKTAYEQRNDGGGVAKRQRKRKSENENIKWRESGNNGVNIRQNGVGRQQ